MTECSMHVLIGCESEASPPFSLELSSLLVPAIITPGLISKNTV